MKSLISGKPVFLSFILSAAAMTAAAPTVAEVIDSSKEGFSLKFSYEIQASTASTYQSLTQDIGAWWLDDHTWYGDGSNMQLQPQVLGCLCEVAGDKQTAHMQVVKLEPEQLIRLIGGLGPLQGEGLHGVMDWQLQALSDTATQLTVAYRVGGYSPHDLSQWASAVDSVLQQQMTAMKTFTEQK